MMARLEELTLPFPVRSHAFRRTLETNQIREGAPLHFVELLSNHVIKDIVMKHYNIVPIAERRALFDKYFPKAFAPILA